MLNKFTGMQQMMKKMGKFQKMMARMGGGAAGLMRRRFPRTKAGKKAGRSHLSSPSDPG